MVGVLYKSLVGNYYPLALMSILNCKYKNGKKFQSTIKSRRRKKKNSYKNTKNYWTIEHTSI